MKIFKKYFVIFFRTFSNIEKKNTLKSVENTSETVTREKNNNSTDESEYEQQDIENSQKRNSASQDTFIDFQDTENRNKGKSNLRFKKRKIDQSKSIDDTFNNVTNALMNYLESSKEKNTNNQQTVDHSFIDYIRVHLQNIPEPEKSARKKMLFEALVAPLP